ncbi:hypothetical protein [Limnothrix redekei]|uniref:Uncharacterized protein n=1 Tax=Limnothrix redekei LRLZ20PSL1 TaxID=3112953 RepID=A0ABW7C6C9_9CYAN
MTLTQLDRATAQISHLAWRDRLVLLWRIFKTLLPLTRQHHPLTEQLSDPLVTSPSVATQLLNLHHLCQEEAYTLEIPDRRDRPSAFE